MSYGLALFGLINEANFFVVFIALIVVFFLLGLIIGSSLNRRKKDVKENTKDEAKVTKGKQKQADTLEQDDPEDPKNQNPEQNQRPKDPRYRYYNWW